MVFKVNKKKVKEGGIVEVKWNCPNASSATISINNGFKTSSLEVSAKGSKKFKLNRSNGETIISLESTINGVTSKESRNVVVVPNKKYDSYKKISPFEEKFKKWWSNIKYSWRVLPPEKKQANIIILMIFVILIISSFYSPALIFGLGAISLYLLWTLMKKR